MNLFLTAKNQNQNSLLKKQHIANQTPTREEIEQIIMSLKNNKAPGEDTIIAELWKSAGDKAIDKLTEIFREIWETEKIPNHWTSVLIHALHKKGDKANVNNYRGISPLPVTYKRRIQSPSNLSRRAT